MSIRDDILALTYKEIVHFGGASKAVIYDTGYCDAKEKAADLAEARERELLERQAAMIAELRDIPEEIGHDEDGNAYTTGIISMKKLRAIINKYEVLK